MMTRCYRAGFTLVELSVVLIIISLIVGMTAVSGVTLISTARYSATVSKMAALDQALMAFRIANDRLPCPADLSQVLGSTTYGTEGNCSAIAGGVFVAQNAGATATAAEGGVPTAALGLPSDFMYDGWGNRFRYAVDTGMTTINTFSTMRIGCVDGAITVYGGPVSSSTYPATTYNTTRTTGAIYVLMSHGSNGHGGVTKNAVVNNTGALNSDALTNCHCTSTGAASTYSPVYVQEQPYTYQAIAAANANYNFDDIVTYKERWQMQTAWDMSGTNCASGVYTRPITIDHTKVGTVNNTDQVNFPLLFSGTYSYLATVANGGNVTNANGYDITFSSDAAGKNALPFEREGYNATTGAVNFWVQVPIVSHTADTVIYLQYDNTAITTDQSNQPRPWDSNYKAVWHLDETSGQHMDSTSNGNNSSTVSVTAEGTAPGKIGGADQFTSASGNYVQITGLIGSPSSVTLSGWGYLTTNGTSGSDIISIGDYTEIRQDDGGTKDKGSFFRGSANGNWYDTATTPQTSLSAWHYFVYTFNNSNPTYTQTFYVDGVQKTQSNNAYPIVYSTLGSNTFIGHHGNGSSNYNYGGYIDEVHISNAARSADWIKTEYNNQSSPSTFYTVGSVVSR